jgi:prepilin-type N-terminal cleavage/methylation domain-containing protein
MCAKMRVERRERGFSLVEMMVALTLMAIAMATAIPAFTRHLRANSVKGATISLAAHMRLARQKAVTEGVPQIVSWDENTDTHLIVSDENENGVADNGEPTLGPFAMPENVSLTNPDSLGFSGDQVIFIRSGSASETGRLVVSGLDGESQSLLLLGPTGQVRVE